nr:MAG TPA: hypothetical protein [Caudoviricetes sp.]
MARALPSVVTQLLQSRPCVGQGGAQLTPSLGLALSFPAGLIAARVVIGLGRLW